MPTYEYECLSCGYRFDVFQNIKAEPLRSCPECNKKLRRLIGAGGGIIFKGSGFYSTDYRKKSAQIKETKKEEIACPKIKEGCSGCA